MTSSCIDVSKIHRRDKAKQGILSRLSGESRSRVISIVGLGGLGKTTLAKLILNEAEEFKTKMWVCVSEPFNLVRVGKVIISEAAGSVPDSFEWEEVSKRLRESVERKKILLVLDDVWTEDPSHWIDLKHALNGGSPGSRIIVTTRNRSAAKNVGSTDFDIYDLDKLSDHESWLVLRDIALIGKEEEMEKFEKLGKDIAIKCKGVSLAITTLASLLFERQTKEEWEDVLASDLWEISKIKNFFLPSLFLSYYSLPPISKQCFLYCAILSKDLQMGRDHLIRLWISQGFFGYDKRRDLERDGKKHFHILAMRSLFQDFVKDINGDIRSCKMHDLVHDFAMYLWKSEGFILKAGDTNFDDEKIRHLSASDLDILSVLKGAKLRTLILCLGTAISTELFNRLVCLRTLVLRNSSSEVLPNEVEKLVHLRYLDLSGAKLLELPETVCNLYNLQVLALNECRNLRKLPEKIGMLSNLSHLEIENNFSLNYLPKGITVLSSLRSLCKFIVSDVDHGCTIGDLQLLNNLRGSLELKGLSRVTDESDSVRAEMKKKTNLQKISFHFVEEETGVSRRMKNVLEKLEPHEGLEELEIRNYPDSEFPSWVQSCLLLTNIVEMLLYRCNGCTVLPAFGNLVHLKRLVIKGMGSVTSIGEEFYGDGVQMSAFSKLECLVIEDMEKLEEWDLPVSKDTKIMHLLRSVELKDCTMLRALPYLGSWESLEELSLTNMNSVRIMRHELYGVGAQRTAFPKLKTLEMMNMEKLEEWHLPISKDIKLMPLVVEIKLENCPVLRRLPCLGSLKSLEKLSFKYLLCVKYIGNEFYGFDENNSSTGVGMIAFPKLKTLKIEDFDELEEWEIPTSKEDRKIMPLLSDLELLYCPKLRALPRVWRMEALEELRLEELYSVRRVGFEFADGDNEDVGVTFPKLRRLDIYGMPNIEEWGVPLITPCLKELELSCFRRLKTLPTFQGMSSWEGQEKIVINDKGGSSNVGGRALGSLAITSCPELRVVPDYMFSPSLEELHLGGVLCDSFPAYGTLCSITHVSLGELPHSSLPKGFHQLKTLEFLHFYDCKTLDFDLKELTHFTELQHLKISECPPLRTILAHLPIIDIDGEEITNKDYKQEHLFLPSDYEEDDHSNGCY